MEPEIFPIAAGVDLAVRRFGKDGAWINFRINANGVKYSTDPWCWTTSAELTSEGALKNYQWDKRVNFIINKLFATYQGGQDEDFVREGIYRAIGNLMSARETAHFEYVKGKRLVHKGQKWLLENTLTIVPEWSIHGTKPDARVGDSKFPASPKFKDETVYSQWLGNTYGRLSKSSLKDYDIFGVGKKHIGQNLYKATDGTATVAQVLSAGMAKGIPVGRHTRELGSFKHAERINISYEQITPYFTTTDERFKCPEELKRYLTRARVAIVLFKNDTMDMMKLTPAGAEKFACTLTRRERTHDAEKKEGYTQIKTNSRTKCVAMNERMKVHDEKTDGFHTCKLIMPGGIKGVAEVIKEQLFDEKGRPIEILLDYISICRKGGMATLSMLTDKPIEMEPLTDTDAIPRMEERISKLEKQTIYDANGKTVYVGIVGELDYIYRAGERPTEQNKLTATPTDIFVDAMKKRLPRSTPAMETEFSKFKKADQTLHEIIELLERAE